MTYKNCEFIFVLSEYSYTIAPDFLFVKLFFIFLFALSFYNSPGEKGFHSTENVVK